MVADFPPVVKRGCRRLQKETGCDIIGRLAQRQQNLRCIQEETMLRVKRLIGSKAFYKIVFAVAVPIMIQNGITNFVSLLDNIMVGQVGTEPMSGVAISNQLLFIFNLCIFGGLSGAGLFTAQYHGSGDSRGVRDTFRFKLFIAAGVCAAAFAVFLLFGEELIGLYLRGASDVGNPAETAAYGLSYLRIMLIGLIPFALTQVYASTLRETGSTVLPMKASIVSVVTNFCLNYLLIFGRLGFPAYGVAGAAAATVIARFAELLVIVIGTHRHTEQHPFIRGAYRSLHVPGTLVRHIVIRGLPLLVNELLWSVGISFLVQCYSQRAQSVIAALNISTTVSNFFNIVFQALGSSVAILVGQQLGAGEPEHAKDTARKLMFFSVSSCVAVGALLAAAAPLIPRIYNTTDLVRSLATKFILISAACMPIQAFTHCCYFTLRSGGKTMITFLFDSAYVWVIVVPFVYALVHFTDLPIVPVYLCGQLIDIVKCVIGYLMVHRGIWVHNIVSTAAEQGAANE